MATSTAYLLFTCVCAVYALRCVSSSTFMCPHQSALFISTLQFQCPLSFPPISPLQVDGDFLDRTLTSKRGNVQTSVLFYASWCPFSRTVHSKFEALASMFPQIDHLAVEQSSAMPSVFSRFGIHSLPTILIVNQTSRIRFRGSKDLRSLVKFYEKTTGFEPVQYAVVAQPIKLRNSEMFIVRSWIGSSLNKILAMEPYLVLSMLFFCLRILLYVFPKAISCFKDFWVSFVSHFNMEMFGGTGQILGSVVHLIDVKKAWTKLKLCKTRKFHEGAKNARVWASSLASVSLGEASSSRSCS